MSICMGTRLYPLSDGDEDETKVWYPLSLDMGMGMGMRINFFYGNGITKSSLTPPCFHP